MKLRHLARLIQTAIVGLTLMATLGAPVLAHAATNPNACDSTNNLTISGGIACGAPSSASQTPLFGKGGLFQKIADVLIFVIGAISVLMIIIGGLRYVLSAGSASAVTGAKDTILYAVIGVVVATLAFAIVQFVISHVG